MQLSSGIKRSLEWHYNNLYRIYVDIIKGGKLSTISVANIGMTYWSISSSNIRGGDGVKGGGWTGSLFESATSFL